jgi:hypothetical protein
MACDRPVAKEWKMRIAYLKEVSSFTREEREAPRVDCEAPVHLTTQFGNNLEALLLNASETGCCLRADVAVPVGTRVTICVRGRHPVVGWVIWRREVMHGVALESVGGTSVLAMCGEGLRQTNMAGWAGG